MRQTITAKAVKQVLSGSADSPIDVQQLNAALKATVTPITGLVLVTPDVYDDPDSVSDKVERWASEIEKVSGLKSDGWFWKEQARSSSDFEKFLSESGVGDWTYLFAGDMFGVKNGLGRLIFVTSGSNMGYIVSDVTHGSGYFSDMISIPNSMKRGKDILKLVADAVPEWISAGISRQMRTSVQTCSVKRSGAHLTIEVEVKSGQDGEKVNDLLVGMAKNEYKLNVLDSGFYGNKSVIEASSSLPLFKL